VTAIKSDRLRIIRFEAENIKKLRAVEITPDGNIIQITGANGSGKSSVLDAIAYALAGARAIDSQPVRQGETSARIQLDLGEIIVTRKFNEDGKSTLLVEAADGGKFSSPQNILDRLIGALTFDPLAFSRMDPKDQLQALRKVVPIDIDIDALDRLNAATFEERTGVNRRVKELAAQAEGVKVPSGLPAKPVDISVLLTQMEDAASTNAAISAKSESRRAQADRAVRLREDAAKLVAQAGEIETEMAFWDALPEPVDTAGLRAQVEQARTVNAGIELRTKRFDLEAQHQRAMVESQELTDDIETNNAKKAAAVGRATMPVPGLSFGDGEVILHGLPFSQASSAEQLRSSVAIAMAANPQLRVLRIKDGGLLDEESMALIAEMADTQDYQVWVETAGTHRPGIVMEDGAVAFESSKTDRDGVAIA
jgi:energy-coupling factor transporter ATP-binding protein EcfA2